MKHHGRAPDWQTMSRADFDTMADYGGLFELELGQVPADDGHGTGDLFTLTPDHRLGSRHNPDSPTEG